MRRIYDLGGAVEYGVDPELDPVDVGDAPDTSPVIFDSARYVEENGEDPAIFDEMDELPINEASGLDLANITPTLGNIPLSRQIDPSVSSVLRYLEAIGIKPSSTNQGKHNTGSKHYSGKAFDLGLNTSFGGDMKRMMAFKNNFEQLRQTIPAFERLRLVDETDRPRGQEVWSGAHFHIEIQ